MAAAMSAKLIRFQIDWCLWIGAALIFFVVSCWIPWVPTLWVPQWNWDSSFVSPVELLERVLRYNQYVRSMAVRFDEQEIRLWDYVRSLYFFGPSVVFSVLFGWVLQCLIVMV